MGTQGVGGLSDGHFARKILGASANALLDWFEYDTLTIGDTDSADLSKDGQVRAVALIFDTGSDEVALASLEGDSDAVTILAQSASNFAAAASGTDGQTNLLSAGSTYQINNENGGEVVYEVLLFRVP